MDIKPYNSVERKAAHCKLIEEYRTFSIMKYSEGASLTEFYRIYRDGELVSNIVAGSPKGCRNIIDTYFRSNI